MSLIGRTVLTSAATWLSLLTVPVYAHAQRKNCTGHEPQGGKWATSAELYLQKARSNPDPNEKADRLRDAVQILQEGFERQPENPRNYAMAGEAYAGLGQYTSADSAFTRAEELWSCYAGHVDTLRYDAWRNAFNQAVRLSQSGDQERAVEMYRNAWTVKKDLPQPMIQIGGFYAQQALDSESVDARSDLQEKAVDAYEKALESLKNPSQWLREDQRSELARAATFNLAQLLAFQGKYEGAAQAYQEFLVQEPDNLDALSNLAVVVTRAATEAERQAEDQPDGPEKESLLAKADSLRTTAASYYTDLLQREDLEPGDYFNLGLGLARLGKYDEAVQAYNMTLEYAPYNHDALEQLALALFQGQQYDTLVTVAEKLLDRYPLSLNDLALLANAYRELDRREDALRILERRDTLRVEVLELDLKTGEGGQYTLSGELHNVKAAPTTPVGLVFDFYGSAGEVVASESLTVEAPAQDENAKFSVTTQSSTPITGFTYRPDGGAQGTGS